MHVLKTLQEEGVATLTISIGEDDHKFEIWSEDGIALVEYQETLTWRGQIETSTPDEAVFKELMVSNEVTEFLDEYDLDGVRRAPPNRA